MTTEYSENGATTTSRMNFSGNVGRATRPIFSWMLTTTCCLVMGLRLGLRVGLDLVPYWLMIMHTYLFYAFRCHCYSPTCLCVDKRSFATLSADQSTAAVCPDQATGKAVLQPFEWQTQLGYVCQFVDIPGLLLHASVFLPRHNLTIAKTTLHTLLIIYRYSLKKSKALPK